MSIRSGKEKNWGSRTGKQISTDKLAQTSFEKLAISGLSDDLLMLAVEKPEEFSSISKSILKYRTSNTSKIHKPVFKSKLGTLYNADCIDILNSIDDNSIDCIFADPPFNLNKDYGKKASDNHNNAEYLLWTQKWLSLCTDKLAPGGALYVYNIPKWSTYISNFLNNKLNFKNWIAIDLTLSMPIPNKIYPSHYSLLYYVKGPKPKTFKPQRLSIESCKNCGKEQKDYGGYKKKMNPLGINLRDIWVDIPPVRHSKYKNRDANELNIKLLNRVIEMSTNEGDLVFDPFGGSGTTYTAAEIMNRRWIGVEIGETENIIERLGNLKHDLKNLDRYLKSVNTLFTDEAIKKRYKKGLSLESFQIQDSQIQRALGKDYENWKEKE